MSTTVKADNEILSEFKYKLFVTETGGQKHILLSNNTIITSSQGLTYKTGENPVTGIIQTINSSTSSTARTPMYYTAYGYNPTEYPVILHYISGEWVIDAGLMIYNTTTGGSIFYLLNYNSTNTSSTTKPSGFPDIPSEITLDEIENLINESLNSTTAITTTANDIQTTATDTYVNYNNGLITADEAQATLNDLASQLEDLNNMSGATLADLVAINNATTQTQLVQDAINNDQIIAEMEEDLTVSNNIASQTTGYINQATQTFQNYSQGNLTQSDAMTQINQYITNLTALITPQTTTADVEAINAAINTINGISDNIQNYSDLDSSISEAAQNSDNEEIEYLENLEAETTDNIDSLKSKVDSSISENEANEIKNNIIEPLLDNTLLLKILPIAALFMVLAVTLGFKYRL